MSFREFITKLQNYPEHKKKIILWTIVIILGLPMAYFWISSAGKSISKLGNAVQIPSISTASPTTNTPQIIDSSTEKWKVYTNEKYAFEIKNPSDWNARDYKTGVA